MRSAVRPHDLEAAADHALGDRRPERLRGRGGATVHDALVLLPERAQYVAPRVIERVVHALEVLLNALPACGGELVATRVRPVTRHLPRRTRQADRYTREGRPRAGHRGERTHESAQGPIAALPRLRSRALLRESQTVIQRHTAVLVHELGGLSRADPELVLVGLRHRAARSAFLDDERADRVPARLFVDGRKDHDVVGVRPPAAVHLRAVQQPGVALAPRGGGDLRRIGAEMRLGEREGPRGRPSVHRLQPALFLRGRTHTLDDCVAEAAAAPPGKNRPHVSEGHGLGHQTANHAETLFGAGGGLPPIEGHPRGCVTQDFEGARRGTMEPIRFSRQRANVREAPFAQRGQHVLGWLGQRIHAGPPQAEMKSTDAPSGSKSSAESAAAERYQRSTGYSRMKPWPPSVWTPSRVV